jgi:hypothetical protein
MSLVNLVGFTTLFPARINQPANQTNKQPYDATSKKKIGSNHTPSTKEEAENRVGSVAGARTFADVGRLAVAAGRGGLLLGLPLEHGLLLRHLDLVLSLSL